MGKRKNENVSDVRWGFIALLALAALMVFGLCVSIGALIAGSVKEAEHLKDVNSCGQLTSCEYYLCIANSYKDSLAPEYETKWLVRYQICVHDHEVKENVK